MTREEKLAALCRIAEIKADLALAPLARAQAEVTRTRSRLGELAAHRNLLTRQTDDPVLAALTARQSARLRHAQALVNQTLAQQQVALETAKAQARPAVGRHHVLQTLLERQVRAKKGKKGSH